LSQPILKLIKLLDIPPKAQIAANNANFGKVSALNFPSFDDAEKYARNASAAGGQTFLGGFC
jgi:hypothetical protein